MCVTTHNCSSQAEFTETPKSCILVRYISLLVFKRLRYVSHIFCRLHFCPSISSPAFSTPCNVVHHFPVLHFPALHFCPSFSSPAFSTPAMLSDIFQSCIFQPCTFVRHFPVLHFPALHFCPSFSSPALSTHWNFFVLHFPVLQIQRPPWLHVK